MLYSKEIMKHFKNPRNVGKMKNPTAVGKVGNLRCGDIMYLYLKIEGKRGKEIIKDVKFETFGCTVAIANTSLLTTMIKGKTLKEALKIKKDDMIKKFGEVPFVKIHCSMLALDALAEAIYDYYVKSKEPISKELQTRHEQAEKIGREIEERHKGLVDLEEKIHGE
jgi:nitrogen fixation NifU-like protein